MPIILWTLLAIQDEPRRPEPEFAPLLKIEGTVEWFGGSYEEALEEARKTERLVLVHLWAHW